MKTHAAERTGVLILHLWIEPHHETGLRARITQSQGSMATEESVAVAATADAICAVVKQWVDAFTDSSHDGEAEAAVDSTTNGR